MRDIDGLRICTRCRDRETTSESGICHACREQEMIDDAVPESLDDMSWCDRCMEFTPFDGTSVCPVCKWDTTGENRQCRHCGGSGMLDDSLPCDECDGTGDDIV